MRRKLLPSINQNWTPKRMNKIPFLIFGKEEKTKQNKTKIKTTKDAKKKHPSAAPLCFTYIS